MCTSPSLCILAVDYWNNIVIIHHAYTTRANIFESSDTEYSALFDLSMDYPAIRITPDIIIDETDIEVPTLDTIIALDAAADIPFADTTHHLARTNAVIIHPFAVNIVTSS